MRAFIFRLNLLCLLVVCLFACDHRSSHPVLHRADSLLKVRQPDSAMILLKSLPSAKRLPKADRAYYAILLAAATDKLELPLLPCDTWLNFALDYYNRGDYERAWALLYKGRLLAQMDDEKAAIEHSLEALEVLQDFPKDTICRRLIYSSLGLWYEDCLLYDKALEALNRSLQYSLNAKDSAIDYNSISFVYGQWEMEDSALFYQRKAVDYGILSRDSDMMKKSRKVMTEAEHEKLKKTIFEIYADYISAMQTQYPRLTDGDLLLLCLQEADISSLTIALCFGYSDTSTINQRKSRLRVKMS